MTFGLKRRGRWLYWGKERLVLMRPTGDPSIWRLLTEDTEEPVIEDDLLRKWLAMHARHNKA